jgi:UDP-2-acetamido-2,6-beta-L-arabino-hexul-4-ose reductase
VAQVGTGLPRALYATYLSYLPGKDFLYPLERHEDHRGYFAEILKTIDSGQFSVLAALPGITRGDHYHHTKAEKFVVIEGEALFRFRHIVTGETYELRASGADPSVVETIPGWSHNITNVGSKPLIALLWASEVFDPQRPDTIIQKV